MSVLLREFLYYADGGNAVWTRLGKGEFFMGVVFSRLIYIRGWRTLTVPCCCIDRGVEGRVWVDMAMIFSSGVFVLVAILTA